MPLASPGRAPTALPARDRTVIAILLVASFVVILNETIMGVALPRLMVDLDVSASTGQWLTTAFMLTMAVVIPTTGFALQRLTTRTVFLLAMGLFSAGTLLAGLAPGFWVLLLARVVQASGTAIMIPLLMTTILTLVPVERRGAVIANVSVVISVAPAIGPTLSGLILQFLSWRFMFLLVLPVALAALLYGYRRLVNIGESGTRRLDWVSVVLSVPAFGGVVFGLSRLGEARDSAALGLALAALAVGVVGLAVFVRRQLGLQAQDRPLLDLRAFRYPMYRRSVVLLCLAMMALFGMVILLPIYLQSIRGLGSLATGLLLLPGGLTMGLLATPVGRLFDRYGPRLLTTGGATAVTVALAILAGVSPTTPVWALVGAHLLLSVGLAGIFTPTFTTGLNPLPPDLYSHGSAILTTLQQVAGAAGVALLVAIMAGRSASLLTGGASEGAALLGGLHAAFAVAAAISAGAIGLAWTLRSPRRADAAAGEEIPAATPASA